MWCTNDIAMFIIEHGVKINNDTFVRIMLKQLVTDTEISSIINTETCAFDSSSADTNHENNAEEDGFLVTNRLAFDDYPGDELRENENGAIVYSKLKIGYVKSVYIDGQIFLSTVCHRLFNFLRVLILLW